MPTINQLMAKMNRQVATGLARTVQAMPPDKQTWQPEETSRSALDQIVECGAINFWFARILGERAIPPLDMERYNQIRAENDTIEKALALLQAGTDALISAIEAFPPEHLEDTVLMPWDTAPTTLAEVLLAPYWNMTYHLGQINYIQTLYGDKEMH